MPSGSKTSIHLSDVAEKLLKQGLRAQTEDLPRSRVWNSFLHGDDESSGLLLSCFGSMWPGRERFKLILAVEDGPWLLRKAFIKKPMLPLGRNRWDIGSFASKGSLK